MNERERSLLIPKNSPVLLDTNVLIDAVEFGESFQAFIDALQQAEVSPALSLVVRLEFLRGFSKTEAAEEFLDRWFGNDAYQLPLDASTYGYFHDIDRINQRQGNKKVQFPDLLIAAQVARYSIPKRRTLNLLLATQNHKDFSPAIFDLKDVMNIRVPSGVIKTIGLYNFNVDRFEELRKQV